LYNLIQWQCADKSAEKLIVPLVPGVNVPASHFSYLLPVMLVSGVWHEMGHAIAAEVYNQHVQGFGILFAFILPAAYCELPPETTTISHKKTSCYFHSR